MKKLTLFFAILISASAFATPPIKGGYLGRRFIVAGEFGYSPNYYSLGSFLTSYNPQVGANFQFVASKYWQVGVNFSKFWLGDVKGYEIGQPGTSEKIIGSSIGFTARKYRIRKGGLAPIGKFIEFGVTKQSLTYKYEDSQFVSNSEDINMSAVCGSVAFGVQEIFKDRIVANCGVRFGGKLLTLSSPNSNLNSNYAEEIVNTRLMFHNSFTPFAGIGIIF
jgi:hypothetical protein